MFKNIFNKITGKKQFMIERRLETGVMKKEYVWENSEQDALYKYHKYDFITRIYPDELRIK